MLNVGVIGRGAIGSLLAAKLITSGYRPIMHWRKAHSEPITVRFQNRTSVPITANTVKVSDVLIVPVKAWQVYDALTEAKDIIRTDTCIVLLHNGVGTEEWVQRQFPQNPIVRMTTSIAARKINTTEVIETGTGATQAGWLRKANELHGLQIEALFNQLLSPCEWFDDIRQPIWSKLAINAVINPLTAIHNIQNGKLSEPQFDSVKTQLIREFIHVARAAGLTFEQDELAKTIDNVIGLTAENYSSMHQDIVNQRKTEVDFINGYLVETARQHQINVAEHEEMLNAIKALESQYLL